MNEVSFKGGFVNPGRVRTAKIRSLSRRFFSGRGISNLGAELRGINRTGYIVDSRIQKLAEALPEDVGLKMIKRSTAYGKHYSLVYKHPVIGEIPFHMQFDSDPWSCGRCSLSVFSKQLGDMVEAIKDPHEKEDMLKKFVSRSVSKFTAKMQKNEISPLKASKVIELIEKLDKNAETVKSLKTTFSNTYGFSYNHFQKRGFWGKLAGNVFYMFGSKG